MKIDLSQTQPVIEGSDLAKAFDLPAEQIKKSMRNGEIASRFETGVDADAGTHRLTFWYGRTKVRFTCDLDGTVLKTSRIRSQARP